MNWGVLEKGNRSETVQSPVKIKVTKCKYGWDPGLLLMTD